MMQRPDPRPLPHQVQISINDIINMRLALKDVESKSIQDACVIFDAHILAFAQGLILNKGIQQ